MVLTPIMHDTPGELAQPFDVARTGSKGECEPDARQDHAGGDGGRARLPRHLSQVHLAWAADGASIGNGGKGIGWNTETEVEFLGKLNGR